MQTPWLHLQFLSVYDAFVRVEKIRCQQRIEQGRKNRSKTRRKVLLLAKVDSDVAAKWPREFVSLANLDLSEADSRQRKSKRLVSVILKMKDGSSSSLPNSAKLPNDR